MLITTTMMIMTTMAIKTTIIYSIVISAAVQVAALPQFLSHTVKIMSVCMHISKRLLMINTLQKHIIQNLVVSLSVCLKLHYIYLNFLCAGRICNQYGNDIPTDSPPPPRESDHGPNDWTPYEGRIEFELANFLYRRNQMSASDINCLLNLWGASSAAHGEAPPFRNHKDLYSTIDSTPLGDVPWESFSLCFNGTRPNDEVPGWMDADYEVWFRSPRKLIHNIISNPDFSGGFDFTPYQEHDAKGTRRYHNVMSGNWAWRQAVCMVNITLISISHAPSFC